VSVAASGRRLLVAGEDVVGPFLAASFRHPIAVALLLDPLPSRSYDVPTVVPIDLGLATGAAHGILPRARTGSSVYVFDRETIDETSRRIGSAGVRRAMRTLTRQLAPALLAAPADDGTGRKLSAALRIEPLSADRDQLDRLRASTSSGSPLLVDVRGQVENTGSLVAVLEAGAVGALVRTGDSERDRKLLDAIKATGVVDRPAASAG